MTKGGEWLGAAHNYYQKAKKRLATKNIAKAIVLLFITTALYEGIAAEAPQPAVVYFFQVGVIFSKGKPIFAQFWLFFANLRTFYRPK